MALWRPDELATGNVRSYLSGLVALTTLASVWVSRRDHRVARDLADALHGSLGPRMVYVALRVSGGHLVEATKGEALGIETTDVKAQLRPWLERRDSKPPEFDDQPTLQFTAIGVGGEYGCIVASHHPDSDRELVSLLLRVGANLAAALLASRRLLYERGQLLEIEQQRAAQLAGLAHAALDFNKPRSVREIVELMTVRSAEIVGAHLAACQLAGSRGSTLEINAVHLSDKYVDYRSHDPSADGSGIYATALDQNQPVRLTQAELLSQPGYRGSGESGHHPPLRGLLAAPLRARDGTTLGVIQLSDRLSGEFSPEDQAILIQLAQMASIAIENARLIEQHEQAATAKDELLGLISHELRTPLTSILAAAYLVQHRAERMDQLDLAEVADDIQQEAVRMQALVENMLVLPRIELGLAGDLEPILLQRELPGVIAAARKRNRGHPIEIVVADKVSPVVADASYVAQIVENLVSNAAKYTAAGTPIEIQVSQTAEEVSVRVLDRGDGVAAEDIERVFDPYYRGPEQTRTSTGLGLGLRVCRRLVEAQGGRIWAVNRDGGGLEVGFALPIYPELELSEVAAAPGPA
jgi:signal transduction histidine kinase